MCNSCGSDDMGMICHGASKVCWRFVGCHVSMSFIILFIHASALVGRVVVLEAF